VVGLSLVLKRSSTVQAGGCGWMSAALCWPPALTSEDYKRLESRSHVAYCGSNAIWTNLRGLIEAGIFRCREMSMVGESDV
jgi:hypothetical protein